MKLPHSAYEILISIQIEKQTKIYLCYITFLQSKLGTKNELQTWEIQKKAVQSLSRSHMRERKVYWVVNDTDATDKLSGIWHWKFRMKLRITNIELKAEAIFFQWFLN